MTHSFLAQLVGPTSTSILANRMPRVVTNRVVTNRVVTNRAVTSRAGPSGAEWGHRIAVSFALLVLTATLAVAQGRVDDAYRPPQDGYQTPPSQGSNQSGGYSQPNAYGTPPYGSGRNQAYGGQQGGQQGSYGGGNNSGGGDRRGNYGGSERGVDASRVPGEYTHRGDSRDGYQRDGGDSRDGNQRDGNQRDGNQRDGNQRDGNQRDGNQRDGDYANNETRGGYGQPYSAPSQSYEQSPPPSRGRDGPTRETPTRGYYEQGEIVEKGRGFFGSITQGLASAIEHTFRQAGRPNGYILGEDGGGAFFAGLRYGEGVLYTKDAGDSKIFWQGPSLGFDVGGEGSKVMILVYKLSDPNDIFERYAGVEGSTYAVGGVSVQFQKHNDITLAVIRSGVGLRLGANVGYSKFTRRPTWNPF